ncbi:MAG: peptidylprolyl isomerase [Desulfuromonadaceae bacterium]|nr:peptidylprolyl isomerase [Desulfuromonadaceae bacterium]
MTYAKQGDSVKIHYQGTLSDGELFDSSRDRDPLEFRIGEQQVIPGFEKAVIGMSINGKKTVTIAAEDAYGPLMDQLIAQVDREQLPEDLTPELGMQLQMMQEAGEPLIVTVTEMDDKTITIDANHPLAGKDLTFDLELVAIS